MKTLSHLIAALSIALPLSALAQTVYRCNNEYRQTPCDGGTAVRADDARTASDRKAHEASVQKEKRVADTLERQRIKDEQAAHQAATRAAAQEDQVAREAARREAEEAAKKKKASQSQKIKTYATPKPAASTP